MDIHPGRAGGQETGGGESTRGGLQSSYLAKNEAGSGVERTGGDVREKEENKGGRRLG